MVVKVLVLGGTGMLGSVVTSVLRQRNDFLVQATQRISAAEPFYFDATNPKCSLQSVFSKESWDYVINCIGITKSMIDEKNSDSIRQAELVNTRLPQQLAQLSSAFNLRCIHISTDAVFSGNLGPYNESAATDPVDIYGQTKLAGEANNRNFLTLRCSIIGPDPLKKRGLFEWFRSQPVDGRIPGFTDHWWNGVTTHQFADLCGFIISEGCFDAVVAKSSLRHFCPNRSITKFQLLEIFKAKLNSSVTVYPSQSGHPTNRVLISRWNDLDKFFSRDSDMTMAISTMLVQPVAL